MVHLRPLTVADVSPAYLEWLCDPEVNRHLEVRFSIPSFAELKDYVRGFNLETRFLFGIFANEQREPLHIGNFSIEINPYHRTASFGYLIGDKRYWGTPAATEAIVLFLSFAFEVHHLRKVWGGAYDSNFGSVFNFHRFGFNREGVLREQNIDGDEPVDALIFGLLREEWVKKRVDFENVRVELHIP